MNLQPTRPMIPTTAVHTLSCPSCQAKLSYTNVTKQYPHLYCTHCHNVYVEQRSQAECRKIWTNWSAEKLMSTIQSRAPLCSCGGMFLFNASVHCVYCGEMLPLPEPTAPKRRLVYDRVVVFDATTIMYDDGKHVTYRLTHD